MGSAMSGVTGPKPSRTKSVMKLLDWKIVSAISSAIKEVTAVALRDDLLRDWVSHPSPCRPDDLRLTGVAPWPDTDLDCCCPLQEAGVGVCSRGAVDADAGGLGSITFPELHEAVRI